MGLGLLRHRSKAHKGSSSSPLFPSKIKRKGKANILTPASSNGGRVGLGENPCLQAPFALQGGRLARG